MKIYRSQKYLDFIRRQQCLKCAFGPSVPHHEDLGEKPMADKAPDSHSVPLCPPCHDLRHMQGPETFWTGINVEKAIINLLTRYLSELRK